MDKFFSCPVFLFCVFYLLSVIYYLLQQYHHQNHHQPHLQREKRQQRQQRQRRQQQQQQRQQRQRQQQQQQQQRQQRQELPLQVIKQREVRFVMVREKCDPLFPGTNFIIFRREILVFSHLCSIYPLYV